MKEERQEYQNRINQVMNYVVQNLAGDLSLDNLSRVACFSPYHFHRIFRLLRTKPLGDYIRRQRLESACLSPDPPESQHPDRSSSGRGLRITGGLYSGLQRSFRTPAQRMAKTTHYFLSIQARPDRRMFLKTTDSKLDQAASKAGKAKPSPSGVP
jgi:methylphosphotriester-DNA--protein-cysteine methyltransferase